MFEGLLQPMHLLLILIVGVFFFGPKKIPELGRGLGDAIRGFRDSFHGDAPHPPADASAHQVPPPTEPQPPSA